MAMGLYSGKEGRLEKKGIRNKMERGTTAAAVTTCPRSTAYEEVKLSNHGNKRN